MNFVSRILYAYFGFIKYSNMLTASNILSYIQLKLCVEQLLEIKNRYYQIRRLDTFFTNAINELSEKLVLMFLSAMDDYEGVYDIKKTFTYSGQDYGKFTSIICDLKHQFRAEYYLFLRALLAKSEEETIFLLQRVQFIAPENLSYQIINLTPDDDEEFSIEMSSHLADLAKLTQDVELKDYFFLINLIESTFEYTEEINILDIAQIITRSSLPPKLKYNVVYLISERVSYDEIELLLNHIKLRDKELNWIYQFLYGNVYFQNADYHNALRLYNRIDTSDDKVDYYTAIEILYKQASSLWYTGNKGYAILQWREILFSGNYDFGYSRYYYNALVDLGRYYVQLKDAKEADKVLSKMHYDVIEFVEDLVGKDYFLFIAEKALLDGDKSKAISYYRKICEIDGDKEIADEIQKLSDGKEI